MVERLGFFRVFTTEKNMILQAPLYGLFPLIIFTCVQVLAQREKCPRCGDGSGGAGVQRHQLRGWEPRLLRPHHHQPRVSGAFRR